VAQAIQQPETFKKLTTEQLRSWATLLTSEGLLPFFSHYVEEQVKDIAIDCIKNKNDPKDFYVAKGIVLGLVRGKGALERIVRDYKRRIESSAPSEASNTV
jgi:hypothetical protein